MKNSFYLALISAAIIMLAPAMTEYAVCGKCQNGYTVFQTARETRVMSKKHYDLMASREIVDTDQDGHPDAIRLHVVGPLNTGGYNFTLAISPTKEDIAEWNEAMKS